MISSRIYILPISYRVYPEFMFRPVGLVDYLQPIYILKTLITSQLAYFCSFILMLFVNLIMEVYGNEPSDTYLPTVMRQPSSKRIKKELH